MTLAALSIPAPAGDVQLRRTAERSHPRRPSRATQRSTVRLTLRGRLVVLLAVVLAALGVFAERGGPAESTSVVHHPHLATVVVAPGETVWDIARTVSDGADPRAVVAEIEDLNSLPDAGSIRVGQPLYVPAS